MLATSQAKMRRMLLAAEKAVELCREVTLFDLVSDDTLASELTMLVEIVAQSAKHIPESDRAEVPSIDWNSIVLCKNISSNHSSFDYYIKWDRRHRVLSPIKPYFGQPLQEWLDTVSHLERTRAMYRQCLLEIVFRDMPELIASLQEYLVGIEPPQEER